jgi:hypothetical protein
MKFRQITASAGLGMVVAPMIASAVMAAPAGFSVHRDTKGNVYFPGSDNGELQVTISGLPQTKNLTANACGIAIYKNSATKPVPSLFKLGTVAIASSSLPTQLLPKCLPSGQLEEARSSNFKTSAGDVVLVGLTPNASVQAVFDGSKIRKVKMNACGWGRISNSSTSPFSLDATFTPMGGSSSTYGDILNKTPWICKDGVTYQPIVGSGS